jgi:ATPase subunit of ABC transporter with duplicated ATPase domains
MADLEDQIAAHDGYTLEGRSAAVLEGLGIPTAVHHAPLGTLSGGFKLRVLLAQVWSAASTSCCSTSRPTTSTS